MPSADSCALIRAPCGSPSSSIGTGRRPPQVSSIAFPAHLPDLQLWPLMDLDFAIRCPLVRPRDASYPVSVRQVAALLHTAFRPHLAMTPLCFANPSPPSGWIGDFHPQAIEHARHTTERLRRRRAERSLIPGPLDILFVLGRAVLPLDRSRKEMTMTPLRERM